MGYWAWILSGEWRWVVLRTSTLILGRTSHRLTGQEVEWCPLINRQPRAVGDGPDRPGHEGTQRFSGNTHPRVELRRFRGWEVVVSGPVVLPPLSQEIVVWKMRNRNNFGVPLEVLAEPVGIGTPGAYVA